MIRFRSIVGSPARALLALVALAGLLAASAAPAPANVIQEAGKSNLFVKELNKAGKSGDSFSFTRLFGPSKGKLTVSTVPFGGLIGDCKIRVKVVNLATGATVVNQTATLTFANSSKTFTWNVPSGATSYRMTVTNLGTNKPMLIMEVK